jgi:hypothetical protein
MPNFTRLQVPENWWAVLRGGYVDVVGANKQWALFDMTLPRPVVTLTLREPKFLAKKTTKLSLFKNTFYCCSSVCHHISVYLGRGVIFWACYLYDSLIYEDHLASLIDENMCMVKCWNDADGGKPRDL